MSRPAVLVVTRNFPPLTGGMERLMLHAASALSKRFDVTLIGPTGCGRHFPQATRVIECPSGAGGFLLAAALKGSAHCARRTYRYVIGGSGLVAPIVVLLARLSRATPAVHVHGLDLVVRHHIYQALFVPMIRRCRVIIANSSNTKRIAIDKGCSDERVAIINPGTRLPTEAEVAATEEMTRSLPDKTIVLFVGRIVARKGLLPFVENAWQSILEKVPNAHLLVVGDDPENALLRDAGQTLEFNKLLKAKSLRGSVTFLGEVEDELLWRYYALANVLAFPLIHVEGDVEGFGMVAIEAAACGTPTVAFSVGGVPDAIEENVSGHLIQPDNYAAFAASVISVLENTRPSASSCKQFATRFSWPRYDDQLLQAFEAHE